MFKSNNSNYRNESIFSNSTKPFKKLFLFNNESFPVLVSPKNQEKNLIDNNQNNTLLTKVLHDKLEKDGEKEEREKQQLEKEEKEKHWVVIKKGVPYQKQEEKKKEEKEVEPRKVFEQLTKNYENWKKNYIESWGYDEYERYYHFPNFDYSNYETIDYNSDLEDY
jgi:hypothetical protein